MKDEGKTEEPKERQKGRDDEITHTKKSNKTEDKGKRR